MRVAWGVAVSAVAAVAVIMAAGIAGVQIGAVEIEAEIANLIGGTSLCKVDLSSGNRRLKS